MNKVRYGIIGLGNQGSYYAVGLFDKGATVDAEVTALCDINPAKIESIKGRLQNTNAAYFTDYKEMLDSGLCDAILVETPHYQHPEIVMEALSRGIHVICDKPAGVYTKQVREMNESAGKSNALFTMMFNQRTNCVYRKMREMVQAGKLGRLQRVNWVITNWFRTQTYYDSGSWRATWEGEGGGVLINQCPHQLDLVSWIIGELPVSVHGFCGYGQWHNIEVEDEVTAFFRYKNGATGTFITTTGEAPGTNRLEISGTLGRLVCEGDRLCFWENETDSATFIQTATNGFAHPKHTKIDIETDGETPQHIGIINNFTAAILGREPLFVDGTEGIRGVELMNAIELSGWKGGAEVTIPVDEEEYLSELNAHRAISVLKTAEDAGVADTAGTF
jgi:predicted dehydrogenase